MQRQAKRGEESNTIVNNWVSNGLNTTNTKIVGGADNQTQTWDSHGMLFRRFDDESNDYEPTQIKIISSTIAITDDNWNTTKTAIGKYYYEDSTTGELKTAYGVNAETIIGKLFLGEHLELENKNGSLKFNDTGLFVENENNSVRIDPDDTTPIFDIRNKKNNDNILSVDTDGNLVIKGSIIASKITLLDGATVSAGSVTDLSSIAIDGHYTNLIGDKKKNGCVLILDNKDNVVAKKLEYNDLLNTPSLSTVATSGKYSDLSGKPDLKTVATSGKYTDLKGSAADAGKLLYVNTDGSVTTLTISELKALLK